MENVTLILFNEMQFAVEKHSDVPDDLIEKYSGKFMGDADDFDILLHIWKQDGFANYQNGFYSTVNPDEYSEIARKFPDISATALVFMKTCVGGLFIYDELPIGKSILYLNVHSGERDIVSTHFEVFFSGKLGAESFWKRECYGKTELKVIDKYGALAYDECYAFVPALAFGESESIAKMQKVKVKEQLELLSQLY